MSDREILRRTVARELETISQYEQDAEAAADPRVRAFLEHLANEEKEHVAEGMAMLQLFDRRQAELAARGAHFLEETPAQPAVPDGTAPEPEAEPAAAFFSPGERFTVGSLRPRERKTPFTPPEAFGLDRHKP